MNQELMIMLAALHKADKDVRWNICRPSTIDACEEVSCENCPLQGMYIGYAVDLINTARKLAHEPRTATDNQLHL